MMIRRYAVLDADGFKISTITADEAAVNQGWYPGYGAALVDEGENPADPLPAIAPGKPDEWQVIAQLPQPMVNGDKLDVKTGEVIKRAEAPIEVLP
jgi:hypothetical protein